MDLLYLFRVLLKRKWLILILSFLAAVATFFLVFNQKDSYQSVAQYSTGFTEEKIRLADGTTAVDLFTADSKFNNVIETFRSPRVIGMLSYRLLLHDLQNPTRAFRSIKDQVAKANLEKRLRTDSLAQVVRRKISRSEQISPTNEADIDIYEYLKVYGYDYKSLNEKLSISRVARTDYLNIVFSSEHAELSAFVVNTLGSEFLNYYQNLSSERTQTSATNIQSLINTQQLRIDSLNFLLRRAKVSQGAIDPVTMSKTAMETVTGLESDLATSTSEYNQHKFLYETYQSQLNEMMKLVGGSSTSQTIINLKTRRDNLAATNSRLSTPDPDITREIADLDNQIRVLSSSSSGSSSKSRERIQDLQGKVNEEKALMEGAKSTMNMLQTRIGIYNGKSNINPGSIVDISALEKQLEIETDQLATLRERYNQAEGLVRDDPTSNFKQTLVGQPAVEPVPKNKLLKTGLAGAVTMSLLSLLIIFTELFDARVKTPGQFQKLVPGKLLGIVNAVSLKKTFIDELMTHEQDPTKMRKEYLFKNYIRKLRHEVVQSGKKIVLVTSTQVGTGKSTLIQAIAYSYLLSKKKVLLLDLNLNHNTITETYHPANNITDLDLENKLPPSEMVKTLVCATSFDNLYAIGCPQTSATPSEIINLEKFGQLLHNLREEFDVVLVEGPALNERADTQELMGICDGAITVFSADHAIGSADIKSFKVIAGSGDRNLGTVLNKVQTENINF